MCYMQIIVHCSLNVYYLTAANTVGHRDQGVPFIDSV